MRSQKVIKTVKAAVIAAIYFLLTSLLWEFSSLGIQVRASEALCVLTFFTSSAVPGLTVGCFLSNLASGNVIDTVFGTLATLLSSLMGRYLFCRIRGRSRLPLAILPFVLINAVILPPVLFYGYGLGDFMFADTPIAVMSLYCLTLIIGQTIACYGLGIPLYYALGKADKMSGFINDN